MKRQAQQGIALIEALIAVLILAIGLLGTIGLQARAYSVLSEAGMRAEATMAADSLLGIMVSDQANLDAYALAAGATPSTRLAGWYNDTRVHIPGAAIVITVGAAAVGSSRQVDVSIGWTRRAGSPAQRHQITSYIAPST